MHAGTPTDGRIIYSEKTKAYAGQMHFLAEKVFSGTGRTWSAEHVQNLNPADLDAVYRGFYLSESLEDDAVRALLENQIKAERDMVPSLTPHMEEKADLAFIWDRRFESFLKGRLGEATFNNLRKAIPPNWIVGQEQHFALGLPNNMQDSIGLASLSRSKRAFVLKSSGFSGSASWGEGVDFIHKKSAADAAQLLTAAHQDNSALHVVQQFTKGKDHVLEYEDGAGGVVKMSAARIRLTPYFSAVPGQEGKLVAAKATARENTDYIHGASDSINSAVDSK